MSVLVALLLGLSRPPAAYVSTAAGHVPLAISSWCWGARCGAPIGSSKKVAVVHRGTTVKAELGFTPTKVSLAVVGHPVVTKTIGHEITWRATRRRDLTPRDRSPRLGDLRRAPRAAVGTPRK